MQNKSDQRNCSLRIGPQSLKAAINKLLTNGTKEGEFYEFKLLVPYLETCEEGGGEEG